LTKKINESNKKKSLTPHNNSPGDFSIFRFLDLYMHNHQAAL